MTPAKSKKIKTVLSMMNKQNQRMVPVVRPLVEMMDMSASEEELDFLIKMGAGLYNCEQAFKAANMPAQAFDAFFDTIRRKGLVHVEYNDDGKELYRLNAIVVGWYEVMVLYAMGKPEEKEFSQKWDEYFKFFKKFNFPPLRNVINLALGGFSKPSQGTGIMNPEIKGKTKSRTIPINATLSVSDPAVYPTFHVNEAVEKYADQDAIYLFPCVCRHGNTLIEQPCNFDMPKESCIVFGDAGRAWAGYGYGRQISKDEAIDILKTVREKGAIHSMIHERDDCRLPVVAICNCCWDCCGILKHYNMGAVTLTYKVSYSARVKDDAKCKGCGNCEKFCPTTAIKVIDKRPALNSRLCIGCGQCAFQCRQNNIELYPNTQTVYLPLLRKSEIRVCG
jgi:Pyruvate/2-oxoacid:ferredoxin oxidoreductase delta subunit